MEQTTPMLKQYQEIKAQHPHAILFFRLGDFYEMFGEDARKASGILDVVLTSRDAGKSGRIPMCGIPYHAAETYIAKLIKAGLKVAICEQLEDPALAKGIVKRDVIRMITAGTYIDESNFESRQIISIATHNNSFGIALSDTASGVMQTNEFPTTKQLIEVIAKMNAYECIFAEQDASLVKELFQSPTLRNKQITFSPFENWAFHTDMSRKSLQEHFKTHSLRGFGIEELPAAVSASGALLEYLKQVHKQPLRHMHKISLYSDLEFAYISPAACFGLDLELLLRTIDNTRTSMGKRCLRNWLYHPLKNKTEIDNRQQAVTLLHENPRINEELGTLLNNTPDIEKSISRISCNTASAKDLLAIRSTLLKQPGIQSILATLAEKNMLFTLSDIPALRQLLAQAINPDIPLAHAQGHIIQKGHNAELDSLKDIRENGKRWLKDLQEREIKRSGIHSLKVGFNQVFGYYIEISRSNLDRVPGDYIRKQTLANAERYITAELKEFEEKILTAEEKIIAIEHRLVEEIFKTILDNAATVSDFCKQFAQLDALQSLGILSNSSGYCPPAITEDFTIDIKDGRHPVVEKSISEPFIPNNTLLDCNENHLTILTGPNMAGKSTYIRQTAILVIMAQIGSYVPAANASIGIVDKIFTRIGAHDEITKGQSTFMVEMSETAGILNNLSARSLLVLDEIGRGTSTFDGLSLAWAIAEYIAKAKTRCLFATHFHELTALADEYRGVKNYNVSIKEWNDEVIFLHKIVPGGCDDSYGIYVAKLAGVPNDIVRRAEQILARLELTSNLQQRIQKRIPSEDQLTLFAGKINPVLEEIQLELEKLDLNSITPMQALNKLQELKEKIQNE